MAIMIRKMIIMRVFIINKINSLKKEFNFNILLIKNSFLLIINKIKICLNI